MGIPLNVALCAGFARWPLIAIIIGTTSALVARAIFNSPGSCVPTARRIIATGLSNAWMKPRPDFFCSCLFSQTLLTAAIGGVLMYWSGFDQEVPLGIGTGIVVYAVAVAIYTLIALCRNRRAAAPVDHALARFG